MPPLPDYANVLRVRLGWTIGDDATAGTTLHFKWSGTAPTNAACATIASDIFTAAASNLVDLCGSDRVLTSVTVQDLTSPTAGVGEHTGSEAGTDTGDPLPASACCVVTYGISRRYRGGKPRSYWPFGTATSLADSQHYGTGFATSVDGGLGSFFAAINGAITVDGCTVGATCSVSYYEGFTAVQNPITGRWRNVPNVRSAAIAPDTIAGLFVQTRIGSQRRRLGKT